MVTDAKTSWLSTVEAVCILTYKELADDSNNGEKLKGSLDTDDADDLWTVL